MSPARSSVLAAWSLALLSGFLLLPLPLAARGDAPDAAGSSAPASPSGAQGAATPADAFLGPPETLVFPQSAPPGAVLTVAIRLPSSPAATWRATLEAENGAPLAAAPLIPLAGEGPEGAPEPEPCLVAFLAIPDTAKPGPARLRIADMRTGKEERATTSTEVLLPVDILPREFLRERIRLDKRNTDIRTGESEKRLAEAEELQGLLAAVNKDAWAAGPFQRPVDSERRTAFYGDRRLYVYAGGQEASANHAGVDFGVPVGTPVRASGSGRVVFAGSRIVTGNTVIIEHRPGVFSLYYHLDSIGVPAPSRVEGGETIGHSGCTGLATGPHLHWELRVAGIAADPDELPRGALLDKGAILGKMAAKYGR